MSHVQFQLPAADAARIMNVLFKTTDTYFAEENRLHTPEHHNAIKAEQTMYQQLMEQTTVRGMTQMERELTPREKSEVLQLLS